MNQRVSAILNKIHDVDEVNSLLVSAFVDINQLIVGERNTLSRYVISTLKDGDVVCDRLAVLEETIIKCYGCFSFELLIEFFEFVVSPSDKIVTGAIYTPCYIRETIVNHIFQLFEGRELATLRIADIACGCGGFFLTFCEKLIDATHLDCHYIYENMLFGCDIEEYCIERTKILLSLKALERGERIDDLVFNLYQGNSLCFDWNAVILDFSGFDAIVGNPPYVTAAKMDDETRALLNNWRVCASGKADLYIPFFQIAIESLNETGVLGYITVSNFYRSLNGKALREYFAEQEMNISIVDFGGEQVFKGCSTYTCLFFADRQQAGVVRYVRTSSKSITNVADLDFVITNYDRLDTNKGWVIKDNRISRIIRQIEGVGPTLNDKVTISNGIATLKNELYVLNIVGETEQYYLHEYEGVRFPIERDICRQVVKPSALDAQVPIDEQIGVLIYPYEVHGTETICYDEERMREQFPHTFEYLQVVKDILDNRDKGKREYEEWYAYGRRQAINLPGFRLLMPYIAEKPSFILSSIEGLLYYNGFALISDSIRLLERLNKVLSTDIFWFYVMNISKPYANGYYSMGKRYIRYFGIPAFTDEQLRILDSKTQTNEIEDFLYPIYFGNDAEGVKRVISDYIMK